MCVEQCIEFEQRVSLRASLTPGHSAGRCEVGADVLVGQDRVGEEFDVGAEELAGDTLEPEHVEQTPLVRDVADEATGGGVA